MKKFLFFFLIVCLAPVAFAATPLKSSPRTERLEGALEEQLQQASSAVQNASKEQEPFLQILQKSPRPVLPFFKYDGKISLVTMREFFASTPADGVRYVGTYGASTCIIVVIVSKKDGRVVSTGLAHIDATCLVNESGAFFGQSVLEGDEADIYLLSSYGDEDTALRILKFISFYERDGRKFSYFVNLRGPEAVVINAQTGEVFEGCPIDCLDLSPQELTKRIDHTAMQIAFPSALKPSLPQVELYKRRFEESSDDEE